MSGALSAWARFDPANREELRQAAAVVARSAQDRRPGGQIGRRVKDSPMGTAFLFMSASSDKPTIGASVLVNQLIQTASALRDYHVATNNQRQATALQKHVIGQLRTLKLQGYQPEVKAMSPVQRDAWSPRLRVAAAEQATSRPQIGAPVTTRDEGSNAGR